MPILVVCVYGSRADNFVLYYMYACINDQTYMHYVYIYNNNQMQVCIYAHICVTIIKRLLI